MEQRNNDQRLNNRRKFTKHVRKRVISQETINEIGKPLPKVTKRKKKSRSKLIKLEIKRRHFADTSGIQMPIRAYFEVLHYNKLEKFKKKDKFLDIYGLSELSQREINNLNRL